MPLTLSPLPTPPDLSTALARSLRLSRLQMRLSQAQMAAHLGCSRQTLWRFENAPRNATLPLETVLRYLQLIGAEVHLPAPDPLWKLAQTHQP